MSKIHPLKEYRVRKGLTLAKLACRVGVQVPALSKIENWQRMPSMSLAARIQEATNGAVTPNDFLSDDRKAS
jgi:transcriptional regulator with XRE-family HTH domain